MTREELAEMATLTLDVHWPESEEYALDKAVAYLVEALWPVLAQVWGEGADAERMDLYVSRAVNPYREQS